MKWRWNRTMLICAVLWWPFWKWRPVEIFQCQDIIIYPHIKFWWYRIMLNFWGIVVAIFKMATVRNFSMLGINIYPHIKFWWYRKMLNFYRPYFMPCFGSHFENGRHFENFEVININVRNFKFPIEFYSNPHPLWTPQNMTLTPFTTKLKTLGTTSIIYL